VPESLHRYGWADRVATLFTSIDVPGHQPGRVVRVDRGSCQVITASGTVRATPFGLVSRRSGVNEEPATGDWVALVDDPDEGWAIVAILPRWSAINRRDPDPNVPRAQVVAANVDVIAAVCALDRPFSENRVERLLALAWDSGAVPAVVLSKSDVTVDSAATVAAAERVARGADVILTSARTGDGVDGLRALVPAGRTLAFLGLSGAGKSSLVNCLLGDDRQEVREVRGADRRGRHTTTTRDLLPLPGAGVLIDTPGLRSIGLWGAEDGVAVAFDDISELASNCKFRDCRHTGEPGCAVIGAVERGSLDARRLASYRKLQRELAALELLHDVRARRAASRRWGRLHRDAGAHKDPRRR